MKVYMVPEGTVEMIEELSPRAAAMIRKHDCMDETGNELVNCSICGHGTPIDDAHLHQNEWVGECCWDDRLKITE